MEKRTVAQAVFETKEAKRIAVRAMKEADEVIYSQHLCGIFDEGDPNHPKYNKGYNYATGKFVNLFGYSQDELIAKQY